MRYLSLFCIMFCTESFTPNYQLGRLINRNNGNSHFREKLQIGNANKNILREKNLRMYIRFLSNVYLLDFQFVI